MTRFTNRREWLACVAACLAPAASVQASMGQAMPWGDSSRLGRPFSKDPSVLQVGDAYRMYVSLPPFPGSKAWGIGIAESPDRLRWRLAHTIEPVGAVEAGGICAPCALELDGRTHLFYQTYGRGKDDAICHAVSEDGVRFERDPSNPIFRPNGEWNCGRAIDAEVALWEDQVLLLAATRDPAMKTQMLVAARAKQGDGFGRDVWTQIGDGSIMRPELPWERQCIEAPSLVVRDRTLYMFYAGGYNNEPQQIGVARSDDGVRWERLSDQPFLPNGEPGSWNASESGHPCYFADRDGSSHLFFQGNSDHGRTWQIASLPVQWTPRGPVLALR